MFEIHALFVLDCMFQMYVKLISDKEEINSIYVVCQLYNFFASQTLCRFNEFVD